jgi:regulatory protein
MIREFTRMNANERGGFIGVDSRGLADEFLMPVVTKIVEQKKRPNRRNVYLDGAFAFGLNDNVIARFRLREGMSISAEMVAEIAVEEVRQECFDYAMKYLQARLHSGAELRRKLLRREYGDSVIDGVLADLLRMGYLDDARFAKSKALSAAEHKHHGRRRVFVELVKAGVKKEVAEAALDDVYEKSDSTAAALLLAEKRAPGLKKLQPAVARRRLAGMLMRRGFDYETIKPVIDQVLGDRGGEGE